MRRLIESLTPGDRPISWTWIGTMLAFYTVMLALAANLYVGHPTRATLVQKAGASETAGPIPSSTGHSSMRGLGQVAFYD